MFKKVLVLVTIMVLSFSVAFASYINVFFMSTSPYGGVHTSYSVQVPAMNRSDVIQALGQPHRTYGYLDVWLGHDQIYLGYYNMLNEPTAIIILPVTSW